MRALRSLGLALALVAPPGALAATFTPPPAPAQWVTDGAGALSAGTRAELNARLSRFEQATGHQVIVWIGQTTLGVPLEEWAARTFAAWGIGRRKLDDGAAVFVFMRDRRLRIEVGYGLEPTVPDAIASRIIRDQALPRLKQGDADGAVRGTVDGLLSAIGGEPGAPKAARPPGLSAPSTSQLILFGILGLLFLLLLITHPGLAVFLLFNLMSGRGGGGGFSGGGFSGGGGRSGGGGASGSW